MAGKVFAFLEDQMYGLPRPWWAFLLLYEALLLGAFALEQVLLRRVRAATGDPTSAARQDRRYVLQAVLHFAMLQAVFVRAGRWWSPIPLGVPVLVAGVALAILGEAIRVRALLELADNFSYVPEVRTGHRLVTSGPYRFVRHPLYLGLLVYFAGIGLVLRDLLMTILILAYVGATVSLRMRREEAELRARFGERFEEWRRRTRKLLPGLY